MSLPVIPDLRDKKFKILKKVVRELEKDGVRRSLARNGVTPINESVDALKIILASSFFELEISYFVDEVKGREKLREFLNLSSIPETVIYTLL